MTGTAELRGLAFDVFGTVVDWRTSIAAEAERVLGDLGLVVDGSRLADAWRERYRPSMDRVTRGELPWTSLDDLLATSLEEVLGELGQAGVPASARQDLVLAWRRLRPWPDSREGLARLGRRYALATLSNGSEALLGDLVRWAELPFGQVLSAEQVRAYKPDPRTYRLAAERLGPEPHQVMLVAAHWYDLEAAAACGLRVAFVSRPLEWGPDRRLDVAPRPWLDAYADDLIDLAGQLGC